MFYEKSLEYLYSLWVAWFNHYVLKAVPVSQAITKPSWSWNCKKIMKLRPLFFQFVESRNGVKRWNLNGGKFSIASVWEAIRPQLKKVPWHRLVWSAPCVPKHNLIAWMVAVNRLPTKKTG